MTGGNDASSRRARCTFHYEKQVVGIGLKFASSHSVKGHRGGVVLAVLRAGQGSVEFSRDGKSSFYDEETFLSKKGWDGEAGSERGTPVAATRIIRRSVRRIGVPTLCCSSHKSYECQLGRAIQSNRQSESSETAIRVQVQITDSS